MPTVVRVAILLEAFQKTAYLVRIGCLLVMAQMVVLPQSYGSKHQQIIVSNRPRPFLRNGSVRIKVTTDAVDRFAFMQWRAMGTG